MSSGLYTHTTRATGTVLTAAIYNADHVNHITNQNPTMTGAYSDNVAQMQATTSPGGVGSESLAGTLAGELERLRYGLKQITGGAQWYSALGVTLVASTSVLSPILDSNAATNLLLKGNGITAFEIAYNTAPATNNWFKVGGVPDGNNLNLSANGSATHIGLSITTKGQGDVWFFNSTGVGFLVHGSIVNPVNRLEVQAATTGSSPIMMTVGSDTDVHMEFGTQGAGAYRFKTNNAGTPATQYEILHTASANRNITITGSNGGNPTINTTAGNLALTSAGGTVAITGNLTVSGTWSIGTLIAGAGQFGGAGSADAGIIRLTYLGQFNCRNSAGSANIGFGGYGTKNGVGNLLFLGRAPTELLPGNGVILVSRSGAGAPTSSDLPSGDWMMWRDTSGSTTKLYYNNAGTLMSVSLA